MGNTIITYTPQERDFAPDFQIRTMFGPEGLNAAEELRAEDKKEKDMIIEGYFAVFGEEFVLWDDPKIRVVETIDRHAFDDTLGEDIRALIDHKTWLVMGRNKAGTFELRVDDHGLFGRIRINRNDSDAVNLWHRVQRRDVSQCSIGFFVEKRATESASDAAGKITQHITLQKIRLCEGSVCTFPAYRTTNVEAGERRDAEKQKNREWGLAMLERLEKKEDAKT